MQDLNFIAPINSLSYGVCGVNLSVSLASKCNLSLFLVNEFNADCPQRHATAIRKCVENSAKYNPNAPSVRLWHQNGLALHAGKVRIGFPIFELDAFNPIEKHHIESVDALFVCSEWARWIVLEQTKQENVFVVPLGVDRTIFHESELPESDIATFIITGKWEIRKSHDILARIFSRIKDKRFRLIIACYNPFYSEEENNKWAGLFSDVAHNSVFLKRLGTQEEIANLYRQADCLVSPSRAEGWNLPALEMMSCGRHVITTNYSAHTEFCNQNNSRLIEITEKTIANDGKWFTSGIGSWAKISKQQEADILENIVDIIEKKKSGDLKTNVGGIETAINFSWDNSANKLLEGVKRCIV